MIGTCKPSLMIHGGAGTVHNTGEYHASVERILILGKKLLEDGASAVDTVEYCVMLLEDDQIYNSGKGSVLNAKGNIEMDAAIMDGKDLSAGSVAAIHNIKNPIYLARLVMEKSPHVMLIGEGAMEFARENNVTEEAEDYFLTEKRKEQWTLANEDNRISLDHADNIPASTSDKKYGTVGAVARDTQGNLAAATSTGGLVNKKYGRVGDTPIIGAGVFADNETCAVSATGIGEHFIRTVLAKHISDLVKYRNLHAQEAADEGVAFLKERIAGIGGVIVVDHNGNCGVAYSTPLIIAGILKIDGTISVTI